MRDRVSDGKDGRRGGGAEGGDGGGGFLLPPWSFPAVFCTVLLVLLKSFPELSIVVDLFSFPVGVFDDGGDGGDGGEEGGGKQTGRIGGECGECGECGEEKLG